MQRLRDCKYILFDADHTLLNYLADERGAYERLYASLGVETSEELLLASRKHSEESWTDAGLYQVGLPSIQKQYHTLYRTHTEEIFKRVFAQFPTIRVPYSAKQTGLMFLKELEHTAIAIDGAEETLAVLAKKYRLGVATNGLSVMQRARLVDMQKYFDKLFISEELGVIKPTKAFFEKVLKEWGINANECLMVGDSLHSDILGAKNAGMDCCWFNPHKIDRDNGIVPDYEIQDLRELIALLD